MQAETIGSVTIQWNGAEVMEKVRAAAAYGATDASVVIAREMKRMTGIQGPPASLPGQPPRMDTTSLNNAITISEATPRTLVAYAGIAADATNSQTGIPVDWYALGLEFGTSHVAARPWVLRSLNNTRAAQFAAFKVGFSEVFNA